MNQNKILFISLISSIVSLLVSVGINLILTPYLIEHLGNEAYGYVGLANNFINYVSLLTIALNSMAGRFITIKYHNNDFDGVNRYFNSVLISNILLAMSLSFPISLCIVYINRIINISSSLLFDVQLLFFLMFLNFILSICSSVFAVATFATNKIYLSSLRSIESNIIRLLLLVFLFGLFKPSIYYIGIATVIATIYILITNIYYSNKLIPEVNINKKYFDIRAIYEVTTSGIWNTLTRISQILLDGLDLLISNIFINASAMGVLAISKTVPGLIGTLLGTVSGVFMPRFTISYANDNKEELLKDINFSILLHGFINSIPLAFLFIFGDVFYTLWVPGENTVLIHNLSILACISAVVAGAISPLFNVFTVTNKLKVNTFVMLFIGVLSTVTVFILLNITDWGVYAIAGVSSVFGFIKNLTFTCLYAAKCLKAKWYSFYPPIIKSMLSLLVLCFVSYYIKQFVIVDSWIKLVIISLFIALVGTIVNYFIVLNKVQRQKIKKILKRRQ